LSDASPTSSVSPPYEQNILLEASSIVYGPREAAYSHPRDNFERTATLWNAYFQSRGVHVALFPEDVAMLMVLLKMARLAHTPDHRDSVVDMAGYVATYARTIGMDE
jgi:hypothetical protein